MTRKGELTINGQDAWTTWGICMDDTSLATLMTPPAAKDYPSNKSRLESGTRYITNNPQVKERDITLKIQLVANTKKDFYAAYNAFCTDVLRGGTLDINTRFQSGVVYHCLYNSCSQYTQYTGKIAKFSLKLTEPDPTNRTEE